MNRRVAIFFGAVIVIVVIAPFVTVQIWQWQARAAVVALTRDSVALTNITMQDLWPDGLDSNQVVDNIDPDVASESFLRPSGALRIENQRIFMPIYEGQDASLLFLGAWRSPWNSSGPEEGGNVVLFGHRFLNLPPSKNTMFNLDKVDVGDEIVVEWDDRKKFTYRVTGAKVVQPSDLSVLDQTQSSTLTLITCTPLFSTAKRLVVTAELVE